MKIGERYNPWKLFAGIWIPNWLKSRKELSWGAKATFAQLCQYAGKEGDCFPELETIAEELGISPRSIDNYIKELKDNKLIQVIRRGLGFTNEYHFLWHEWIDCKASKQPFKSATNQPRPVANLDSQDPALLDSQDPAPPKHDKRTSLRDSDPKLPPCIPPSGESINNLLRKQATGQEENEKADLPNPKEKVLSVKGGKGEERSESVTSERSKDSGSAICNSANRLNPRLEIALEKYLGRSPMRKDRALFLAVVNEYGEEDTISGVKSALKIAKDKGMKFCGTSMNWLLNAIAKIVSERKAAEEWEKKYPTRKKQPGDDVDPMEKFLRTGYW